MKEMWELFQKKILVLRDKEKKLGARMFLGIPDRWFESPGPKWRCKNNHVSALFIDSEACGDSCIRCGFPVFITFPEDKDGPLND